MPRTVEVPPERLDRWIAGFRERHGAGVDDLPRSVTGADGATAQLDAFPHDPLGVVLVRRGGYAVGLASGDTWVDSKVGTRHVQSRTAAGGWSQQRFARRRGNQADALVAAVAAHAERILVEGPARPAALVVGGDRALVGQVLSERRLAALAALPRRELYGLPDPTRAVLQTALRRGCAVRITLSEPD